MHKSTTLLAPRKPHAVFWRIMQRSAEWEVAVERPVYDMTIFKLQCGKLTLKCYTKGERVLRIEAMVHNTQHLDCGRSLEKFPHLVYLMEIVQFGRC